ncbi:MAG: lipid-A-disaccharide synthase [Xanthomonadaceae bacterium]|nr:lipid-A-disaccharide synthase [Xanthomonadaceae bacterium]MDE1884918.1 lipid-A-disaccharide synthase [Xanthomonadaceae bacterium]MDE1961062.1 lipid-A-disaccharide synthase [Xanthomonadaceae bacterium]MDE2083343.1 lipid-A-disaccharide synthase [Xanthomonadaceae bacterium]
MTPDASPLFVLVAGEASGDLLGAGLIEALRERFPAARFAGIGGPRMAACGMEVWHPCEKLSVMGLVEVLRHLPELLAIRRDVYKRTLRHRPAAFVGIDAPDFNLGLERRLKQADIKTVHYVSPSIWAWREARALRIGASADRVLCLFPMEPPIYVRHGVDARFVGHPLADAFALEPDVVAARRELGLPSNVPVLALLPGSRLGEIRRLGPDFLHAAAILKQALPDLRIVAPMANAQCRGVFSALGSLPADLRIIDGNAHTALVAADAVLLASGTAALEAMLAKRPMAVAYRIAPLTHFIVKTLGLLRTDLYSLPNILSGQRLVPELMQDACRPDALAAALLPFLRTRTTPPELLGEFRRLHESLRGGGSMAAAAAIAQLCAASADAQVEPL